MIEVLIALALISQQSAELLDAVDRERGGRHWIDQQPDPPKTPKESRSCFQIEPGSRIELVAAEPLVFDPVWIDFDRRGRMYVNEYSDYPIGPVNAEGVALEQAPPLSKIVLLEDADGDGIMDRRTVFADGLKFCHSFLPLMDGILACAQTEILFLKDSDGDNVADIREVWFDGFEPAHPQMQIGCPQWGHDNWIYLTYAPGNVRCRRPGFETSEPVKLPRQDMRFHPLTMKFEATSGLGQFGNTINNNGDRFFSTNRNPIMVEMISPNVAQRNPFVSISRLHADVGPSGGDTKVFPLVNMKSNWLSHAGTHTSACGVSAYRGDLWDEAFQRSVFACEPVGHLVTRSVIQSLPGNPALDAVRARPTADFLASTDTWFRPASLRTGPDGALYLADMYRMWVEHPKFLPPEIAARINWRAGEDKGRIWRVVPDGDQRPRRFTPPESPADLTAMLNDTNGWRRQMAQRVLVETAALPSTTHLLQLQTSPATTAYGRIHAMWTLDGLSQTDDAQVAKLLQHESALVRLQAARLAITRAGESEVLRQGLLRSSDDDSSFVQFLAAEACGLKSDDKATQALASMAVQHQTSPWFQQIILSSCAECSGAIIAALMKEPGRMPADGRNETAQLLTELAAVVGHRGNAQEISLVLRDSVEGKAERLWASTALLTGLARGLPRQKGTLPAKSLAALLKTPIPEMAGLTENVSDLLTECAECATDASRNIADRMASVALLSSQSPQTLTAALDRILSPGEPAELQAAVIQAVGSPAADIVLERWKTLGPGVRSQAIVLLLARPATTQQLLTLMSSGVISSSAIDIDQRVRLLQHSDESIRKVAGEIFGGVVSANRKAVADDYQSALTMTASNVAGAAVFERTCSKCHKIDGKGHQVGPDISDTRNRSRDALLYDILDPNRRVDPQFGEYIVVTTDGRTLNGLLVSDAGQQVVLRQAEGKEVTLPRSEIEELQANNKSLMPEGIEKDVTVQQMADLLEFLKAR